MSPAHIIARALDMHPERVEAAITALRDAGWHLVSTPIEERSSYSSFGEDIILCCRVDDEVLSVARHVTGHAMIYARSGVELLELERRLMKAELLRAIGERLGLS